MWAHGGGEWPAVHTTSDVAKVNWVTGQKEAPGVPDMPSFFPGQVLLLLPFLGAPLLWGPMRTSPLGKLMLQRRLLRPSLRAPGTWLQRLLTAVTGWTVGSWVFICAYLGVHLLLMVVWTRRAGNLGYEGKRALTVASGLGSLTNLMMVTLPVSKTGIWTRVLGLPFERGLRFHRLLARYTLVLMAVHFALASSYQPFLSFRATPGRAPVVTAFGFLAFVCFCTVALTAVDLVRRRIFEAFRFMHYLTYPALGLVVLHLPARVFGLPYMLPTLYLGAPVALYAIDLALRWAQTCLPASLVAMKLLPDGSTRVDVLVTDMIARFEAGSYYFLNLPDVARYSWHPFSVCGDSTGSRLIFRVQPQGPGTWTSRLRDLADILTESRRDAVHCVPIKVTGPYGRLSIRLQDYSHLILVSLMM
jgi:predicted ferric reductase